MEKLTDQTIMSFGKYKGHKLANVPPDYLLWIYDNYSLKPELKAYIDENRQCLNQEVKLSQKAIRR